MKTYEDGVEAMRQKALELIRGYMRIEGMQKDDSEVINLLNALAGDVMVATVPAEPAKS